MTATERTVERYLRHPPRKVAAMLRNRAGIAEGLERTRIKWRLRMDGLAGGGDRTLGAIGGRRARLVRTVRLFPLARLVVFLRRRGVGAIMHPAVPAGGNLGGFGVAIIDDPTLRLTPAGHRAFVIDIAELVFADTLAVTPGEEAGPHGLTVPPGEDLQEKLLHRVSLGNYRRPWQGLVDPSSLMPPGLALVQ